MALARRASPEVTHQCRHARAGTRLEAHGAPPPRPAATCATASAAPEDVAPTRRLQFLVLARGCSTAQIWRAVGMMSPVAPRRSGRGLVHCLRPGARHQTRALVRLSASRAASSRMVSVHNVRISAQRSRRRPRAPPPSFGRRSGVGRTTRKRLCYQAGPTRAGGAPSCRTRSLPSDRG